VADTRWGPVSDRAVARSDLQPAAPAFSHLDMLSPVDYEERYWDRRAAA
jgi:hypothetical protein